MKEVTAWEVDLQSPERWLRVEGEMLDEDKIIKALKAAGYHAEKVD